MAVGVVGAVVLSLLGVLLLYLAVGTFVRYRGGIRFPDAVPHLPLWRSIGSLIFDGCMFVATCGKNRPVRRSAATFVWPTPAGRFSSVPSQEGGDASGGGPHAADTGGRQVSSAVIDDEEDDGLINAPSVV